MEVTSYTRITWKLNSKKNPKSCARAVNANAPHAFSFTIPQHRPSLLRNMAAITVHKTTLAA